jgi:PAS domain S-box-containing protein
MDDKKIKEWRVVVAQQKVEIHRLKAVIDNLPGMIYWKNKKGVYLGRNKFASENMVKLGLEKTVNRDSVIGKTDYDFFCKETADRYRKNDRAVMEGKKEISTEEPIILPDGKTRVRLSSKRPWVDEKGKVIGVIGSTVDITHLKEIQAELCIAKEKAEEASKAKTGFIRNVEHDIRTPFNGVLGMAQYLWKHETDPLKKEYLGDITQCAKELLDYCNSILDFSNIELGACPVTAESFNVEKLAEKIFKIELPAAKNKNLALELDIDKKIPDILIGDYYRLYRILINLLSNAVKFTKQGRVGLRVSVVKKTAKKIWLQFIVEDTGPGIPEDKKEYVFEKFSRLTPSNTGAYKGSGLGLCIVKQFVGEMKGKIDLVSGVGKGTQFICTVPFTL